MSESRSDVETAIAAGALALREQQRADGSWPGTNFAGPMYTAMTLVVEHVVGALEERDAREGIRGMASTQFDDGSFPSYPFAEKGQLGATGMVYAGLTVAGAATLAPDVLEKTRACIDRHGGVNGIDPATGTYRIDPQTRMYLALAGLVDPATLDKPNLSFKLVPGVDRLLGSRFGLAMVLIANQNAMIVRGLQRGAGRVNPLRHPLMAIENKRVLDYLTTHQNPEGNWAGVIMPTLAGILCLHYLGVGKTDRRFASALGYLRKWKVYDDRGLEVMPTIGVIWNTAEIVKTLILIDPGDNKDAIDRGLAYLLEQQGDVPMPADWQNPDRGQPRTGGWNYYSDNKMCCDADTTGAVLWTFGLVRRLQERFTQDVTSAANEGLAWELGMQNRDGGWPAFAHGQTSKKPGPMYSTPLSFPKPTMLTMIRLFLNPPPELADPATEGLTGRVLAGLGAMGMTTADEPVKNAIAFLKKQQWTNGAWWGRWEVNFLLASGCVLAGLRSVGEDMNAPYVRRCVDWILSKQNDDGGWGESIASYEKPDTAGEGPSDAIITSGVVSALIDAGVGSDAVRRGAEFVLSRQDEQGLWDETQCYYVILPPDYYYTNYFYSQYLALEALAKYRDLQSDTSSAPR